MISQIKLVGSILKTLESSGCNINTRQMNSVIEAVDVIIDSLNEQHRPALAGSGLAKWLASDDTGTSSRYMASVLGAGKGYFGRHRDYDGTPAVPHDPSDFGRCVRLLEAAPELKENMHLLTEGHGSIWQSLATNWGKLESLYREELPSGNAPKLYDAICAIHDAAKEPAP